MTFIYTFNQNACENCGGKCCNGEKGNIWVNKNEIIAIAGFLGIETEDFIFNYLRKNGYKYSIKELKTGNNYACLFFNDIKNRCGIYNVRPEQCRTYPFWPFFKTKPEIIINECPGIILKSTD